MAEPIKFIPLTAEVATTTSAISAELQSAIKKVSKMIKDDLMKPTETWEEKPTFHEKVTVTDKEISMEIFLMGSSPGNEHYGYLDEGTPKHPVYSQQKQIAMPKVFSAKTIPGVLTPQAGERSDENTVLPKGYGTIMSVTARKFTDAVAKIWEERFPDDSIKIIHNIGDKLIK